MNFLETYQDIHKTKCITVIKFKNNVDFQLDSESIKNEILDRIGKDENLKALKGIGTIVELGTNVRKEVSFVLSFHGFFKQTIVGKVWVSAAKHYKEFEKLQPYVLIFRYEDLDYFEYLPKEPA